MKKTEYLYGVKPSLFKAKEYEEVLIMKRELGLRMLKTIRESTRDIKHYEDVEKAVQFNRALWEELNE